MALSSRSSRARSGSSGRSVASFLFGFLFALFVLVAGGWLYLRYGHPPVATADPSFPYEQQIVSIPLNARIDRELEKPPFGTSEDGFEAGAKLYQSSCASCHGLPGHDSPWARSMFPHPPQLWVKHQHSDVVGVSDDDASESYWKIKNGIRLSGMPSFQHIYSETQMWQIALLVKNADQPLPDPVTRLLQSPTSSALSAGSSPPYQP